MKTKLSLILAMLMLASAALTACSDAGTDNTDASGDTTVTDTPSADEETEAETDALDARAAIPDDLPEMNFDGRNFIILGSEPGCTQYITVEELNGEVVNDAVFQRNLTIEERYGATISHFIPGATGADYGVTSSTVRNAVTAGDSDSFHLISYHVVEAGSIAVQGYLMNWYEIPYINFEKPWWSDSNVDDLSMNNHCFLAVGDAALTSVASTYCNFYDKDAAKDYGIEGLYETVRDGKWTVDYQTEIVQQVATDKNGDGQMTADDYFGLASSPYSAVNTYLWAFDNQVFVKNDEGVLEFSYYNERLVGIFDKVYSLFKDTNGVWAPTGQGHGVGNDQFKNYGSLFLNSTISYAISLADFEHDYGIIPYPKYDEAQPEYKTMVDGGHEAMGIALSAADLDFIGVMTEVMCAESYKQVLPAYYDVALKQRYASSPEDAEMIELCVASRVFDLGYVYDNWKGVSFYLESLISNSGTKDITSHYQKNQKAATKYYEKVTKAFYPEG